MSLSASQKRALQALLGEKVSFDTPLRERTTLRIGGPAAALAKVSEVKELASVLELCREDGLPWFCLGRGSNVLIADDGFPGVVLLPGGSFRGVDFLLDSTESAAAGQRIVRAGAAGALIKLALRCSEQGLAGLEFASGIPGSVGGATVMNAGAFGGEMSQVLRRVELVSAEGAFTAEDEALDFCYRRWPWFEGHAQEAVVTAVELRLTPQPAETLLARCRELRESRSRKQQVKLPNAGSFFKNPPGESAGALIEACGLKGQRCGDALVAPEHANFLVNAGQASAAEMRTLMGKVQERVLAEKGIRLEPEVRIIGGE